jgi:hypothetical protein
MVRGEEARELNWRTLAFPDRLFSTRIQLTLRSCVLERVTVVTAPTFSRADRKQHTYYLPVHRRSKWLFDLKEFREIYVECV